MRQRIIDLRSDDTTAGHVSDALLLQAQYGHERACDYLRSVGMQAVVAQRLLAIRYDRRVAAAVPVLG